MYDGCMFVGHWINPVINIHREIPVQVSVALLGLSEFNGPNSRSTLISLFSCGTHSSSGVFRGKCVRGCCWRLPMVGGGDMPLEYARELHSLAFADTIGK